MAPSQAGWSRASRAYSGCWSRYGRANTAQPPAGGVVLHLECGRLVPRREPAAGLVVVVEGDADLPQVVLAGGSGRGRPHLLHGRQQQADQDGHDRQHDQQLEQGEPAAGHDDSQVRGRWARAFRANAVDNSPSVTQTTVSPHRPHARSRRHVPSRCSHPVAGGGRRPDRPGPDRERPRYVGASFAGSNASQSGFEPPDTMAAVGINHLSEFINGVVAFYNKDGSLVLRQDDVVFWNGLGLTGAFGDSRVLYDPAAQRWVAIAFTSGSDNRLLIGRTDGPSATGPWRGVGLDSTLSVFSDYPTLGMNADAIAIGTNNFVGSTNPSVSMYTLPKSSLYTAAGVNPTLTNLTRFEGRLKADVGDVLQPTVNYSPTATGTIPVMASSATSVQPVRADHRQRHRGGRGDVLGQLHRRAGDHLPVRPRAPPRWAPPTPWTPSTTGSTPTSSTRATGCSWPTWCGPPTATGRPSGSPSPTPPPTRCWKSRTSRWPAATSSTRRWPPTPVATWSSA